MKHVDIGPEDGTLTLTTGVEGRAARMGHRLTIEMRQWQARVDFADDEPVSARLVVTVEGLTVVQGEGGVKSLSGPEKTLARSNALGSLRVEEFREIVFDATTVSADHDGYSLTGDVTIVGVTAPAHVDVQVTDEGLDWLLEAHTSVRQTDHGISPYSLMMGSLRVADDVQISFRARVDKN